MKYMYTLYKVDIILTSVYTRSTNDLQISQLYLHAHLQKSMARLQSK